MEKIKKFIIENKDYSVTIVRVGLALVFIWFGISQIANPASFIGYIPQWLSDIAGQMTNLILTINGIFDVMLGLLLLLGIYTRIAAIIASLHLFSIAFSLGYNDIAIRDFGLAIMALSLVFSGAGKLSFDNRPKKE